MNEAVYQAPNSELLADQEEQGKEFYIVSTAKFVVLFLSTLGWYGTYWFYRNWQAFKKT